jgi:signal transduction histidine kinase
MRILIDNALTHTPEGTTIKVGAQIDNGSASLGVADDGPGIEPRSRRGRTEFELRLPAAAAAGSRR